MQPTSTEYLIGFVKAENARTKEHWVDIAHTLIFDHLVASNHGTEYEWGSEDSERTGKFPKDAVYCGSIEASALWDHESEWSEHRLYMSIPLTVYLVSIGAV